MSAWRFDIRDEDPYGGGVYVGGIDNYACAGGEAALRLDRLWRAPYSTGPDAWAAFLSQDFVLEPGHQCEFSAMLRAIDSRGEVSLNVLSKAVLGPESSYRLPLLENQWYSVKQVINVQGNTAVSAHVQVRYLRYGPLWMCEPRLICTDCTGDFSTADSSDPDSADYAAVLSQPELTCPSCTEK